MRPCLFLALVLLAGCRHRFPLPYTSNQLGADSQRWPGEALVHYLSQPNADVDVCTLNPPPVLRRTDEALLAPLLDALAEGTLAAQRWQDCATLLVPALAPAEREFFHGRLARFVLARLDTKDSAPRLVAAHEVLATRPREPSPALEALLGRLLDFSRERLAPGVAPVYDAFVSTLELDHGQLGGKTLSDADVENTQDEALLLRMVARLPAQAQRVVARRRLINLRIARSVFTEVKARAAEVEAAVMAQGRWAQPVEALVLERPEAPQPLAFEGVVRQDVERQVVTLLAPGQGAAQLVPALDLKDTVHFQVGWSQPLGLCHAPSKLVVEPCIASTDVGLDNALVRLDADGVLRLPERVAMNEALELARRDEGLVVPVRLGGRLVTSLHVPLRFETPQPIRFEASGGERGPALNVVVEPVVSALLIAAVSQDGAQRLAIYPRDARSGFEVVSVGGRGETGRTGYRGSDGIAGTPGAGALCPASPGQTGGFGGDGNPGGDGGQGGQGASGGPVRVVVKCGNACPADEALVRRLVSSRGGRGGDGGQGGQGGRGGAGGTGGSSTTCTVNGRPEFLSSGSTGLRGNDGRQGSTGPQGDEGWPGAVEVSVQ